MKTAHVYCQRHAVNRSIVEYSLDTYTAHPSLTYEEQLSILLSAACKKIVIVIGRVSSSEVAVLDFEQAMTSHILAESQGASHMMFHYIECMSHAPVFVSYVSPNANWHVDNGVPARSPLFPAEMLSVLSKPAILERYAHDVGGGASSTQGAAQPPADG